MASANDDLVWALLPFVVFGGLGLWAVIVENIRYERDKWKGKKP